MSQEQLLQAKALIQNKQFTEARQLLEGIDHPTAHKWLAKLDGVAAVSSPRVSKIFQGDAVYTITIGVLLLMTLFVVVYGTFFRDRSLIAVSQLDSKVEALTEANSSPDKWEYLNFSYAQVDVDFDDELEEIVESDNAFYTLGLLDKGCGSWLRDPDCYERDFKGRAYYLNALGQDGWELILVDDRSGQYAYEIDMLFKRRASGQGTNLGDSK